VAAIGAKISNVEGLETLIVDLLTPKWGHGTIVSWASLLPIFSFLHRSVLDSESGTDRQTDSRQRSSLHNAPPYWSGA